jgi:hypothetical protein
MGDVIVDTQNSFSTKRETLIFSEVIKKEIHVKSKFIIDLFSIFRYKNISSFTSIIRREKKLCTYLIERKRNADSK